VNEPLDIVWTEGAIHELSRLDNRLMDRVVDAVLRYATTGAGDVRRLSGYRPPQWRVRVGDWRVRFWLTGATVVVLHVSPRGRAYNN
jgi:mRNA-degrading endonuclease RelE of RelBE toxin-antitoxin system